MGIHRHLTQEFTQDHAIQTGATAAGNDLSVEALAQRLRENEERFCTLADNIPQIAWLSNEKAEVLWYNRRWFEFTGMTFEATRGLGWQALHHPDCRAQALEIARERRTHGEAWEETLRLRGRDGAYRWFLARVVPIRDAQGRVARWLGSGTDVTEQLETEQTLRDVNARLAEANLRKTEFLALLSHELRNPLAPIRNSIYVLRRAEPGSDLAHRSVDVIDRQAAHLTRLVDDLLDATRVASGKIQIQKARVELGGLVRRCAEDHHSVLRTSGLHLDLRLPPESLWAEADATRISQVVGNLLGNAVKFTPSGGHVTLSLEREDDQLAAIRVRDNGIGIEPDLLDKVFEPFMQVDRSLERIRGGLGLGLSLVRGVVELHGGRVEAHSEGSGMGTEVVVHLPTEPAPARPASSAPEAPAAAGSRILIVEDNVDAAESLRMVLELSGHQVQVANDGQEGLALARAFLPDVVLCDIGLPGMDGYAVARAFRKDPSLARTCLVALTGYTQPEDMERAAEAGFDQHLGKPPRFEALEQVLAELPARRRSDA